MQTKTKTGASFSFLLSSFNNLQQMNDSLVTAAATPPVMSFSCSKDEEIEAEKGNGIRCLVRTGGRGFTIAHLADIHIRDRRRQEYADVFQSLYQKLRQLQPTLIVVAGDVFDSKTRASSHNFNDVRDFLFALKQISPVVCIPGNHDTNVNIPGASDLLSAVVVNNPLFDRDFTYWRHSGIYVKHGCVWCVLATDRQVKLGLKETIAFQKQHQLEELPRFLLFHEEVNGARMQNMCCTSHSDKLYERDFEGFDGSFGGHIHLRQNKPRWDYPGSLIQQNIGESHCGHGFLLWTFTGKSVQEDHQDIDKYREDLYVTNTPRKEVIEIINHKAIVRLQLRERQDQTEQPVPKYGDFFDLVTDKQSYDLDWIQQEILPKYGLQIKKLRRVDVIDSASLTEVGTADISTSDESKEPIEPLEDDASNGMSMQWKTEDFIRNMFKDDVEVQQEILKLHLEILSRESMQQFHQPLEKHARIDLKRLEWHNLFCYGPDNMIDFNSMEFKITGLIAPNHSGKSSFLNILTLALFDKIPMMKTEVGRRENTSSKDKAKHQLVSNAQETQARRLPWSLRLDFQLNGENGFIEKAGNANAKICRCRFVIGNEDLTQGTIIDTNKEIARYVGNWFTGGLTGFGLHGLKDRDFVCQKSMERRKTLSKLLAFPNFECIRKEAHKNWQEAKTTVKVLLEQEKFALATNEHNQDNTNDGNNDIAQQLETAKFAVSQLEQESIVLQEAYGKFMLLKQQVAQAEKLLKNQPCLADDDDRDSDAFQLEIAKLERIQKHNMPSFVSIYIENNVDLDAAVSRKDIATAFDNMHAKAKNAENSCYEDNRLQLQLLKTERAVLKKRIQDLETKLPANEKEKESTKQVKFAVLEKQEKQIEEEVQTCEQQIKSNRERLDDAIEQQTMLCESLQEGCRKLYQKQEPAATLDSVSSSSSILLLPQLQEIFDDVNSDTVITCPRCLKVKEIMGLSSSSQQNECTNKPADECKRQCAEYEADKEGNIHVLHEKWEEENTARNWMLKKAKEKLDNIHVQQYWALQQQLERVREKCRRAQLGLDYMEAARQYHTLVQRRLQQLYQNETRNQNATALNLLKQEMSDYSAAYESYKEYLAKLDVLRREVAELDVRYQDEVRNKIQAEERKRSLEQLQTRLSDAQKEERRWLEYNRCWAVNGVEDQMVGLVADTLQSEIKSALQEMSASFEVRISATMEMDVRNAGSVYASVESASGYQRFALHLAVRLALWRMAVCPLPNVFIVDEGFGTADDSNLQGISDFLESLPTRNRCPKLFLAISHLESMKIFLEDDALKIEVRPFEGNRLTNIPASKWPPPFLVRDLVTDKDNTVNIEEEGTTLESKRKKPASTNKKETKEEKTPRKKRQVSSNSGTKTTRVVRKRAKKAEEKEELASADSTTPAAGVPNTSRDGFKAFQPDPKKPGYQLCLICNMSVKQVDKHRRGDTHQKKLAKQLSKR